MEIEYLAIRYNTRCYAVHGISHTTVNDYFKLIHYLINSSRKFNKHFDFIAKTNCVGVETRWYQREALVFWGWFCSLELSDNDCGLDINISSHNHSLLDMSI